MSKLVTIYSCSFRLAFPTVKRHDSLHATIRIKWRSRISNYFNILFVCQMEWGNMKIFVDVEAPFVSHRNSTHQDCCSDQSPFEMNCSGCHSRSCNCCLALAADNLISLHVTYKDSTHKKFPMQALFRHPWRCKGPNDTPHIQCLYQYMSHIIMQFR